MRPKGLFHLLMFIQYIEWCLTEKCSSSSIVRTIAMISREMRSKELTLLSNLINHHTKEDLNVYNWTSLNQQQNYQLTNEDIENVKKTTSVLTSILSNILDDRIEDSLLVITDLDSNDLSYSEFEKQLDNYYLDTLTLTPGLIKLAENAILETFESSIPVIFLLLPDDLAELVLELAERNDLLTKEKKLTWIGFNVKRLQLRFPDIYNIDMSMLLKAVYFDKNCDLQKNVTYTRELAMTLILNMVEKEKASTEITITTLIDVPFVQKAELDYDPLGGHSCDNGYFCSISSALGNNETLEWKDYCCTGLVIDIMKEVKKKLNFDYKIYISPDGQYGGLTVNGSWTGMINEVSSGRADLAIQGITVTSTRSTVVDFISGFMTTSIGIIRRKEAVELEVVNWEFLKTLEADLMFGLLALFVTVIIFMFGLENLIFFTFKGKYYPTREAFSYVAGLTFQRDLAGKTPTKWSARYVAITYAVALTIVMTTYTANLTANNITNKNADDFKGLQDQRISNPTPAFVYGTRKATSTELYFKNNIQPRLNRAYNTHIKHYLTKTNEEGFDKVFNGALDAFVGDYIYMLYRLVTPQYCSTLTIYKESYLDFPLGFAIQKNSKWKHLLTMTIQDLQDKGVLQEITDKWFFLPDCFQETAQANKFPWEYIGGMLIAVAIFVIISIVVIAMETMHTRKRSKRRFDNNNGKNKRSETLTTITSQEECIVNPYVQNIKFKDIAKSVKFSTLVTSQEYIANPNAE